MATASLIYHEDQPYAIQGIARDITERKQMEAINALAVDLALLPPGADVQEFLANRLKAMTGAAFVAFGRYDPKDKVLVGSRLVMDPGMLDKVLRLLGKRVAEVRSPVSEEMYQEIVSTIVGVRRTLTETTFGAVPPLVDAAIRKLLGIDRFIGVAYVTEGKLYGTSVLAMRTGDPDPSRNLLESFAHVASSSLRRGQAEEALAQSESRYRTLFDTTPVAVGLGTPDGTILAANPRMLETTGYTLEELQRRGIESLYVDPSQRQALLKTLRRDGTVKGYEVQLRRKDRSTCWVSLHIAQVQLEGRPVLLTSMLDVTERRRAEETLRESEERFRQLAENMRDVFWIATPGAREILYVSPAYEALSGRSSKALNAEPTLWMEGILEEDRPRLEADLRRRMAGDMSDPMMPEVRVRRADGAVRWIRGRCYPVKDSQGRVYRWVGVIEDVTHVKEAERALRASEREKGAILNGLKDVLVQYLDANQKILWTNAAMDEAFNGRERPLVGRFCYEVVHGLSHPCEHCPTRKAIDTGRPQEEEVALEDGRTLLIRSNPVLEEGRLTGIVHAAIDITVRKRAEATLRESEERFRQIAENVRDVFWISTPESDKVLYVSPAYEAMWGRSIESLTAAPMSWLEAVVEEDRPRVVEDLKRRMAGEVLGPDMPEARIRRPDGTIRRVRRRCYAVCDAQGRVSRMLGVIEDITHVKEVEQSLLASQEQLRTLAQQLVTIRETERTDLAREIHDELGHALTTIKMDVSWAVRNLQRQDRPVPPAQVEARLSTVCEALDQAVVLTREMATRLRPGILDDLGLAPALEWLIGQFESHGAIRCTFDCTLGETPLSSECATALFRICQELLTNVARHAKATEVSVRLARETDRIVLEVRDNGVGGIEPDRGKTSSLGLLGIRERALSLGGAFSIGPLPQRGTLAMVQVPLSNASSTRPFSQETH